MKKSKRGNGLALRRDLGINDPACMDPDKTSESVFEPGDDCYYPSEESDERRSLAIPVLVDVGI